MKPLTFSSTDLRVLQRQLDSLRRRQSGRVRLPGPLWEAAAQLARERSVSEVARRLRIDFYKLQRRVRDFPPAAPEGPAAINPGFLELKFAATVPPPGNGGVVELFDGSQRRLRMETGHDPTLWLTLAEAFWRSRP